MSEYIGIVVAFVFAAAFAALNIVLASVLGPKKPSRVKYEPFECGQAPLSVPIGRLSVKFYLTAILFIVFDVEVVFMYPWAVVFRQLGWTGFTAMAIFLGVAVIGLLYEWRKGALEWD